MEDTANSGSEDKPEPQGPGSPASSGPPSNSDALNAVMASFLGWAFDAFDFFVLVFVLSKAAKEFAVSLDKMTLAITATLAFRPIGALLFGALADRYGRRVPLMWNLAFFSVMEVLSGLAPNFSSFMLCRCLFGVGMGGEWGWAPRCPWRRSPRGCAESSPVCCNKDTLRLSPGGVLFSVDASGVELAIASSSPAHCPPCWPFGFFTG